MDSKHLLVSGHLYELVISPRFTIITEAVWGKLTLWTSAAVWGLFQLLKVWAESIDF